MPAVSPVPTSPAPFPDSKLPIESRSFDSLLAEARQVDPSAPIEAAGSAESVNEMSSDQPSNPLPGLTGIGSIHNASLRQIVAEDVQP